MVRFRLSRARLALWVVVISAAVLAIGAGLIYKPAGVIVAGAAGVLIGLNLIDVEGDESSSARPRRTPH